MQVNLPRFLRAMLVLFGLLGAHVMAEAQRTIKGVVKDIESSETLIGATVLEKGTSNGAVTDIDGNFTLKVQTEPTILVISYTGYKSMEQDVTGLSTVEVLLTSDAVLDDIVIVGYGTVKREDATGLVQTVNSSSFNRGAITGPQELLAGKVAGVVISTDGTPGGGAQIRIRGESSLGASNDPLIVVDGVPLEGGGVGGSRNALNLINPNDIETFTVLKDAAAAAIYGNRASGGVIIITTKKGALGKKINVSYNANVSVGQIVKTIDVLDADEFRLAIDSSLTAEQLTAAKPLLGNANTNWQDEIYRNAIATDHNLSLSGGIGSVPYRVSVGYTNKNGLLRSDNFERYTAAVNLNPSFFNNYLQFNLGFKGSRNNNRFADRGAIGAALSWDPTKPVRDPAFERYGGYTTWTIANGNPNNLAPANPVALLELTNDRSTVNNYIVNGSADYRFHFLPDLRFNLNMAYDYSSGVGTKVIPNFAAFAFDVQTGGGVNNRYEQIRKNSLLETYLNYKKALGVHEVELLGGYSWQHFLTDNSSRNSDAAGSPSETIQIVDKSELYLISLFSRLNYSFNNRIFASFSLRRDGTSRFAPENRWGIFPGVSVAGKLIDNDNKLFNFAKVRLSWGVTGQERIGEGRNRYAYLPNYEFGDPNATYQLDTSFIATTRPNGYNASIKWEETSSYNAGLDFNVIRDRVSGTLDVYERTNKDLLVFVPLPALSNLSNEGFVNLGSIRTRGVEVSFNFTPVLTNKIRWDFSTNYSLNYYEITRLNFVTDPNDPGRLTGGIAGGVGSNIQINTVGYQPRMFYVFEQLYDENGRLLEGQYADRNQDGIVNESDKYRANNPAPRHTIGLTSSLTLGAFDFSFAGRANIGNYMYNNVQTDMGFLERLYNSAGGGYLSNVNQSAVDLDVFKQSNLTFSDHFISNASFLRFDHITAGYTIRQAKWGSSIRFFGTVQNPFVITNYKGIDPEIAGGIDNSTYPRPVTYLFGLGFNF
jgi:TonB-dependent starch-binding outer membrane protein SusC